MNEYLSRIRESARIFFEKVMYGTYFPRGEPVCNVSPETDRFNKACLSYSETDAGKRAALGIPEDDITLQLRAFGTLPPVRTLTIQGSKCDILEWLAEPRP